MLADAGLLSGTGWHSGRRRLAEAAVPSNPLAARPPHFPARAKRVIFLFMNGGPSHVQHLRSQAGPGEARRPGPSSLGDDRAPQTGQAHALAVFRPASRPERNRGLRAVPARGRLHRRDLRAPLDVHRQPESRAVALDDELGQHAADPAQPRVVADFRPGDGEPEPAGLRGALSGQAGRRPAVVEQQLPAGHLPGDAHPQQLDRPGPDHPRRVQPPPVAAGPADADRPAPGAQPRAPRRARHRRGARVPDRIAGDGLPHAVRGTRGVRPGPRVGGDPRPCTAPASSPTPA